jgi:pseudouridine synthase
MVKASTLLSEEQLDLLRSGPILNDGPTRPALVTRIRDSVKYTFLEIVITEGRNRQVRRMVEAIGSKVLKLVRLAIGPVRIGDLPIGKWRRLSDEEIRALGGTTPSSNTSAGRRTPKPSSPA